MSIEELKKSIHEKVDNINDEDRLERLIDEIDFILSENQKQKLAEIREKHFNGKSQSFTWEDAKKFIKHGEIITNK